MRHEPLTPDHGDRSNDVVRQTVTDDGGPCPDERAQRRALVETATADQQEVPGSKLARDRESQRHHQGRTHPVHLCSQAEPPLLQQELLGL